MLKHLKELQIVKKNCARIFKYKTFKTIYYISFHKILQ